MNASTIPKVLKKSIVFTMLIVTLCLITVAATTAYKNIEKESWVNSYYSELSLEERVGLMIWFKVDCNNDLNIQLAEIRSLSSAGVVLENCDCESVLDLSDRLKRTSLIVTAEREEIKDLPSLLNPFEYTDKTELEKQYNEIIEKELELYSIDFYGSTFAGENLSLHEYTGNQRQLKRDILKNDGIVLSNELRHIYYETINLIKTGEISEALLENKVKKILEVKYDKSDAVAKNTALDQWNSYKSLINEYNLVLINNIIDLDPVIEFNLDFQDKPVIIGQSESSESFFKAFKNHIPATNYYPELSQLPSNPESHFNKYIFIDTDIPKDKISKLVGEKLMVQTNNLTFENDNNTVVFPFNDSLSHERFVTILLDNVDNKNSSILTNYHVPEDAGMKSSMLQNIDSIIENAINEEAFPGCQILVAQNGKVILNKSFGYHSYDSIIKVTENSIYDLASITKAASTTMAIMKLSQDGLLDLDKKVSFYIEDLKGTDKENIIIKDVLLHQSGLRSYMPFWKNTLSKKDKYFQENYSEKYSLQISPQRYMSNVTPDSLWYWILNTPLYEREDVRRPYSYKYSDIGFYFLKAVVEEITSQSLDVYVQHNIYDPMGIYNLTYNPLCKFSMTEIIPTEYDKYLRKSLLIGNVHDRNAALRGGVEGHAGLFGNSVELAKILHMLLREGSYGKHQLFDTGTIETFTSVHYKNNRRGLGWDKSSNEIEDNTSDYASLRTFGHTGFTGTGFWADPEKDLIYVFLSNRVYPDAENNKISELRVRENVQDIIYKSILN